MNTKINDYTASIGHILVGAKKFLIENQLEPSKLRILPFVQSKAAWPMDYTSIGVNLINHFARKYQLLIESRKPLGPRSSQSKCTPYFVAEFEYEEEAGLYQMALNAYFNEFKYEIQMILLIYKGDYQIFQTAVASPKHALNVFKNVVTKQWGSQRDRFSYELYCHGAIIASLRTVRFKNQNELDKLYRVA
jgi:hypothetical protein